MRDFLILFKREVKMQFPRPQKGRTDWFGSLVTLLITLSIAVVFIILVSVIAGNYVTVRIDKVYAPEQRGLELLNLCYIAIIFASTVACLEKMRKTLTEKKDKELLLRLPVKTQTIFMSKLATVVLWIYTFALLLILPVNVIFFIAVKPSGIFWLYTFLTWLLMPMTAFLFATALLIPYIKLIEFLSDKYALILLLFVGGIVGAFLLYSGFLDILKSLVETGAIKFLFNEAFVTTLQSLLVWTYPANSFASIVMGRDLAPSLVIVSVVAVVAVVVMYIVSKRLFYSTLYKNENKKVKGKKKTKYVRTPVLISLVKKEFITVFREPKHLFSYFAIALAMPVMVYCCFMLFDSLISNALGVKADFALAVLVVLVFSILTNTFCASNVSRDGLTALKSKVFPVKASVMLFAKVLFCGIVASIAVIASVVTLGVGASLDAPSVIVCLVCGLAFSFAQVFVATRMDLNHTKPSATPVEIEKMQNRTIAKVVFFGLLIALFMGIIVLIISIITVGELEAYAYIIPLVGSIAYLIIALTYYVRNIEKSFYKLVA